MKQKKEIIERIVNEDATNCLVSVCSRLARFGRLGRTWDKTRVFGSGSIDKPSGSTLSGLTLRHLNSSVLTAIRDNRHLWKGAGVAEGRHRKERSAAPPDADRHRISCTAYCYPAIYSNGGAKQRKTSMITRFPLARDKFLLLNAMLVASNWWHQPAQFSISLEIFNSRWIENVITFFFFLISINYTFVYRECWIYFTICTRMGKFVF